MIASNPVEKIFVIIPCAGKGARAGLGLPKQYRNLLGYPLLYHVLTSFNACEEVTTVLLALAPDENYFDLSQYVHLNFHVKYCGGNSRHETVLNALNELVLLGAKNTDWVLVHDAARPGITVNLIRRLINQVKDDAVGGLLALPISDTIKKAALATTAPSDQQPKVAMANTKLTMDELNLNKPTNKIGQIDTLKPTNKVNNEAKRKEALMYSIRAANAESHYAPYRVEQTIARDHLWLAQTPQMFRFGLLQQALNQASIKSQKESFLITDEASAIEGLGLQPILVRGCLSNFKVTYPEDFEMAERLLKSS